MEIKDPEILAQEAAQAQAKAQKNKKIMTWTLSITALVAISLGVMLLMSMCNNSSANEKMAQAEELYFAPDSAQHAQGVEALKKVAAETSTNAGTRANLMLAIEEYQAGKYQEALKYLDAAGRPGSDIIAVGSKVMEGNCLVNLKKYDEALKAFDAALEMADENPRLTPFVLERMANLYQVQKNYTKEAETLERLTVDYPGYSHTAEVDLARAKALAAGK